MGPGVGFLSPCSVQVMGCPHVEAWFSTALDIEEVYGPVLVGEQLARHGVADVIKPFDTVDRSILVCSWSRLGLPSWLREGLFFHIIIRFG